MVVDELGFHQATSVAELLADRGCAVEVATPGMVVGQDLGITLDLETWNVRADGEGHRAAHRRGRDGRRATTAARRSLSLQHHPTGTDAAAGTVDWVVCAVHQRAEDGLWRS